MAPSDGISGPPFPRADSLHRCCRNPLLSGPTKDRMGVLEETIIEFTPLRAHHGHRFRHSRHITCDCRRARCLELGTARQRRIEIHVLRRGANGPRPVSPGHYLPYFGGGSGTHYGGDRIPGFHAPCVATSFRLHRVRHFDLNDVCPLPPVLCYCVPAIVDIDLRASSDRFFAWRDHLAHLRQSKSLVSPLGSIHLSIQPARGYFSVAAPLLLLGIGWLLDALVHLVGVVRQENQIRTKRFSAVKPRRCSYDGIAALQNRYRT